MRFGPARLQLDGLFKVFDGGLRIALLHQQRAEVEHHERVVGLLFERLTALPHGGVPASVLAVNDCHERMRSGGRRLILKQNVAGFLGLLPTFRLDKQLQQRQARLGVRRVGLHGLLQTGNFRLICHHRSP